MFIINKTLGNPVNIDGLLSKWSRVISSIGFQDSNNRFNGLNEHTPKFISKCFYSDMINNGIKPHKMGSYIRFVIENFYFDKWL